MKTQHIFILFICIFIFASCNQINPTIQNPVSEAETPEEIIRPDEMISEFSTNPKQYVLQDVLDYLKNDLSQESNKSIALKENIINSAFVTVNELYNLTEDGTNENLMSIYNFYKDVSFISQPKYLQELLVEMSKRNMINESDFNTDKALFVEKIEKHKAAIGGSYIKRSEPILDYLNSKYI